MSKNVNIAKAYEIDEIIERINQGEKFIVKPKIASRGNGLKLIQTQEDREWLKELGERKKEYIAQEFCQEIRNGERSLFFIGHDYTHAVLKQPNPENSEEIRCNKSAGGVGDR